MEHEPVIAAKDTFGYRTSKFVARCQSRSGKTIGNPRLRSPPAYPRSGRKNADRFACGSSTEVAKILARSEENGNALDGILAGNTLLCPRKEYGSEYPTSFHLAKSPVLYCAGTGSLGSRFFSAASVMTSFRPGQSLSARNVASGASPGKYWVERTSFGSSTTVSDWSCLHAFKLFSRSPAKTSAGPSGVRPRFFRFF
jgi:hypothetical protein